MNQRRNSKKSAASMSVQILRHSGETYHLDKQKMEDIFCNPRIADLPVAIIGMNGLMHCGKSLMLNYFYEKLLQSQSSSSSKALSTARRCFDWGNGIQTQKKTVGIHISKQPVILTTNDQEIAVFLMDTEGLSLKNNNDSQFCVFSLSSLLASFQILNVERDIQDRDVYPLKIFVKAASELSSANQETIFQSELLFLVRDCTNTLKYKFGKEDGQRFLENSFRSGLKKEIEEKLYSTFCNVGCFLMPHPGAKATVKQVRPFNGTVREMNESFISNLNLLMEEVLEPRNLVMKKINGRILTCSRYREYAELCFEAILKGNSVSSLIRLSAHTIYEPIAEDCAKEFVESLSKELRKSVMTREEFSELCERMYQSTMVKYNMAGTYGYGSSEIKRKNARNLEEKLGIVIREKKEENDKYFERAKERNKKAAESAVEVYKRNMNEHNHRSTQDREELHTAAKSMALQEFDRRGKAGGEKFVRKCRIILSERIDEIFQEKAQQGSSSESNETHRGLARSSQIGLLGGHIDHEACTLTFPRGAVTSDRTISIKLLNETESWPSRFTRQSPVIEFDSSNRNLRKPVTCLIPCWYVSHSFDVQPSEKIYVLQLDGRQWRVIHSEVLQSKTHIEINLSSLSAIALATTQASLVDTMLYVDALGNFIAEFFAKSNLDNIKDTAKRERYCTMSNLNTIEVNKGDEITVSLGLRGGPSEVKTLQGKDVWSQNSTRCLQFVIDEPAEGESCIAVLQYEVKVNGGIPISHPFRVNLSSPGRPDTSPRERLSIHQTNARGEYLAVSGPME